MEQKTLVEQLVETKFGHELIKAVTSLTVKYGKVLRENPEIDYNDFGDDKEKKIKVINDLYNSLIMTVSDLELVLIFLKIDRKLITQLFPSLESKERYYKYHLENFIIKTITITDIVGKLGNSIFDTKLNEGKCNSYTFKDKIKATDPVCSSIVERLLIDTKEIKERRNKKLHTGDTELGYFEKILYWDELAKITQSEADLVLEEFTDGDINAEIKSLEKDIRHIIDLVNEFTDYATDKLVEIACSHRESKNHSTPEYL